MISYQSRVPLPQMIDDEYLLEDGEGSQPSHVNPQLGSFVYSSKLFDILNDILVSFYVKTNTVFLRSETRSWSCEELDAVLRLNMALNEFQDSLPSYLTVPQKSETTKDSKVDIGAKILYSRYALSPHL